MKNKFYYLDVNDTFTRHETLAEVNAALRSIGIRSVTATKETASNSVLYDQPDRKIVFYISCNSAVPFVVIAGKRYVLDQLYSYSVLPSTTIPQYIESIIVDKLIALHLPYPLNYASDIRYLVNHVGHEWVTPQGRFHRRLSKEVKARVGVNIPTEVLEEIATAYANYIAKPQTGHFKITTNFSWKRGTFNDAGSCFWTSRKGARKIIARNGGFAFQLFDDEKNPVARSWMAIEKDSIYLFNGYGIQLVDQTKIVQSIYPGSFVKPLHGSNRGTYTGTLYINNGVMYTVTTDTNHSESKDLSWR